MNWRRVLIPFFLLVVFLFFNYYIGSQLPSGDGAEISLTDLVKAVKAGDVTSLKIGIGKADVLTKDGRALTVNLGTLEAGEVIPTLRALGVTETELAAVTIVYLPSNWLGAILSLAPILLFILVIFFLMRRQGRGGGILDFGKSRARMFGADQPTITFDDIAGCEEAKEEMVEVVEFLRQPEEFIALGAHIPKGVILVGPPGCGKTLMARAVAGEANVPFFFVVGSEFTEMFIGVGSARVRDLFDQAKKNAPSIVFIDEIDAIGGIRGLGITGGREERESTLSQILTEMGGFAPKDNVIVLAATNRPDILDPALTRPGRFDRKVVIDRPDLSGREAIFKIHLRGKPLAKEVDLHNLAAITPGFTGADIEASVNEAALLAARRGKERIETIDFQDAIERVIAGPERKSRRISDEEKEIIAYHEAGHALVMASLPYCDPVRKVSIIARGLASLGYTFGTPEEDRWLIPRTKLLDDIAALLGGRAAEELQFGETAVTTGAASDLEKATELARQMVVRFGMSDLGLQTFIRSRQDYLREMFGETGMAEETARLVDIEVGKILSQAYERAKEILTERQEVLERIVKALLERETLTEEEFNALVV